MIGDLKDTVYRNAIAYFGLLRVLTGSFDFARCIKEHKRRTAHIAMIMSGNHEVRLSERMAEGAIDAGIRSPFGG